MNVLIVDDSEELLMLLNAVIKKLGCNPLCCSGIAQASAVKEFDLALVDWNLEDGNGVDFLAKLRNKNPNASLYLMSATKPDETIKRKLDQIGAFYEAKPLSPIRVKQLIDL